MCNGKGGGGLCKACGDAWLLSAGKLCQEAAKKAISRAGGVYNFVDGECRVFGPAVLVPKGNAITALRDDDKIDTKLIDRAAQAVLQLLCLDCI